MPDQNQLEALLRQAAKQLGTSPEQLKNAAPATLTESWEA